MQVFRRFIDKCIEFSIGITLTEQDRKNIEALRNRKYKSTHEAVRAMWNEQEEKAQVAVPAVAKTLVSGALSANQDWLYIQDLGPYISPYGIDNKHTVRIYKTADYQQNVLLASVECTNSIYSEWIVACSNSMWKTQNKVFYDIHGNSHPVGKMTYTKCQIVY
jgi:hypothetical protein